MHQASDERLLKLAPLGQLGVQSASNLPSLPLVSATAFEWSVASAVSSVSSSLKRLESMLFEAFWSHLCPPFLSGLRLRFFGTLISSGGFFESSSFGGDSYSSDRRSFERRFLPLS